MNKTAHPFYKIWTQMKQRCYNTRFKQFADYGGRGIVVCERWKSSFLAFVQDMGQRPDGFLLDRINNDGPYAPENCRWASRFEQQCNQRRTLKITIEGITYGARFLSKMSGLKVDTLMARAKKCTTLQELLDPKRRIFWEGLAMTPNRRTKTHCKRGHEFTEETTYRYNGHRYCRTCSLQRTREARKK